MTVLRLFSAAEPRGERALRRILVGGALLGALVALGAAVVTARDRVALEQLARELALDVDSTSPAARALRRELAAAPNGHRAGLGVARAVVATELDPQRWLRVPAGGEGREAARSRQRLAHAERLATAALDAAPADWQATALLGATRYLRLLAERDVALYRHPERWEAPLSLARRRGPAFTEASRLLTAGYLELWPMLSPAKRARARPVLAEAFADAATFDRFFPAWAKLARNREELYLPLPDRADVWRRVASFDAAKSDWPAWLEAQARTERARRREVAQALDEARARARGGDSAGATRLYLLAAQSGSPSLDDAGAFDAAIGERPAGAIGDALAGVSHDWLEWALPLCQLRSCPLSNETFARLATAPGLSGDGVASALLAAGDLPGAELRERREQAQWSEAWAGTLLLKTRLLLTRGDLDGARSALALVHRDWRRRPAYLIARAELVRHGADPAARSDAEADLRAERRSAWPATEWLWRGSNATLSLLAARPARALRIELHEAPPQGAIVELQWNGGALPLQVVTADQRSLGVRVEVEGTETPNLLRLRTLAGGRVRPGMVELVD